ncbi:MAG: MBL fold metallo-hydrolase [Rhodospirillales bacterium]|nr:MAG: MBL fold metallo-hydrolase [Rhodospirillales bacterium]
MSRATAGAAAAGAEGKRQPPLKVAVVPVTPFQQNCSVVWCAKTLKGAVVDPGGDVDDILAAVRANAVTPELVLLTHGHLDHAGGAGALARTLDVPIVGPHPDDRFWLDAMAQQGAMFGVRSAEAVRPDRWLQAGDTVAFGAITLEVRHCPGHTPGHIIFYHPGSRLALVGDVLFNGSIGRTDFPRGDYDTLIRSIREQLWPLGDDVSFIPGHGPMSTFGHERRTNPFVRDR